MENIKGNIYNYLTAKEREQLSFPAKILLERKLITGKVLDFGCGYGKDVELFQKKNIDVIGYDPHYFPQYPLQNFDTIICSYVLNVLLPEEQVQVLMDISELLKPTGKAYFAVRRDILNQGFRIHKVHKRPTYQCNVKLPFKSIFKNNNCEIYEYQHYTTLNLNMEQVSPFLSGKDLRELISESATAFSIYDKFPVNPGHALVIPKKLTPNYFCLTFKEQKALWILTNRVKDILQRFYNPDGFNIGLNINEAAGQTVPHVHVHIIPRYNCDVEDPRGGIRNVILGRGNYLAK
jgi:diadenosine tetraphosphate (Ap4A) HIT family hydrolase